MTNKLVNVDLHPLLLACRAATVPADCCRYSSSLKLFWNTGACVMQSTGCFDVLSGPSCTRCTQRSFTSWRPSAIPRLQQCRRSFRPRKQRFAQPQVRAASVWYCANYLQSLAYQHKLMFQVAARKPLTRLELRRRPTLILEQPLQ